jgi:midasin (ATPase involved in ribosome maturation)
MDGAGSKPSYNLRTLSRALQYARVALPQYGLQRGLYDGCAMAFLTQLHPSSAPAMERLLQTHILSGASTKVRCCAEQQSRQCSLGYSAALQPSGVVAVLLTPACIVY